MAKPRITLRTAYKDSSFPVSKMLAKFQRRHPQLGRQIEVGWVHVLAFRPISRYISETVQDTDAVTTDKRLCYRRGTARRATLVEILWSFLTELLTRSSANPEEPREHTVSWNRVKCCTNVRRIAYENVCNRWMTFKVIQGHCRCHHLIGHILFPISLPL